MSAESNLASFFAPDSQWSIDSSLPWQPIPIHYLPDSEDKYLSTRSYCPRALQEEKKLIFSPESKKFLKKHEEMFKNLSSLSGFYIHDWKSAFLFHDVIATERNHNLTIPAWVEPYWDELSLVSNLAFYWKYKSPVIYRLRAGPLIQKIIETMNRKINGETPKLKFQLYDVHETSLAILLAALKNFNMIQPPYCSTLMIELFEMPDGVKTVRMLYQNSSRPEEKFDPPHLLILEGCTEFCPLDYFINYTSPFIPEDWDLECQGGKSFLEEIEERKVTILLAVALAVVTFCLMWNVISRRRDKHAYQPIHCN